MTDVTDATVSRPKCIFCKIAAGQDEKTELLFENEELVIFRDIRPAAEHHYLIVPRQHVKDPKGLDHSHLPLVERLLEVGTDYLKDHNGNLEDTRFGFHWPPFTSVNHLHLHVISPTSDMGLLARWIFRPNSYWFVTAEWLMGRLKAMGTDS